MPQPFAPRIIYPATTGTVLDLDLGQDYWLPSSRTIGGSGISAAGVPESYIVRRDELLQVTLRFYEKDWPFVRDFVAWAQENAATFDWYPDRRNLNQKYVVYLDSPMIGEDLQPRRASWDSAVYEIDLILRNSVVDVEFDILAWPNV